MKRCVVAFATRERQHLWTIELPDEATVADALAAARRLSSTQSVCSGTGTCEPDVPWDSAPVGIFGELRDRSDRPIDGDRIEIYRPLAGDPRERRRQQVQQARRGAKRRR